MKSRRPHRRPKRSGGWRQPLRAAARGATACAEPCRGQALSCGVLFRSQKVATTEQQATTSRFSRERRRCVRRRAGARRVAVRTGVSRAATFWRLRQPAPRPVDDDWQCRSEAKPLIDPHDYLSKLKQAFEFRSSYAAEIARATEFGWFLVSFGAEFNPQLLTKRALWCVRTILIARSAELRDPVFAPERLAELTSSASAQDLLRHRRAPCDAEAVRRSLRQFLIDEGAGICALEHADWATFVERFGETSNKVALQTLRQEEESQAGYLG